MAVDASRGSVYSRSVRLHQDTLDKLEKLAEDKGMGVTVLMRENIEDYLRAPQQLFHVGETQELQVT